MAVMFGLIAAAALLPGAAALPLEIRDARIDEAHAGGSSAVSMLLANRSDTDVELTGASSPLAGQTLLQRYVTTKDGLTQVQPLNALRLPAHSETVLARGALEIQLVGLATDLTPGLEVPLKLKFRDGTERTVRVTIQGDHPR